MNVLHLSILNIWTTCLWFPSASMWEEQVTNMCHDRHRYIPGHYCLTGNMMPQSTSSYLPTIITKIPPKTVHRTIHSRILFAYNSLDLINTLVDHPFGDIYPLVLRKQQWTTWYTVHCSVINTVLHQYTHYKYQYKLLTTHLV